LERPVLHSPGVLPRQALFWDAYELLGRQILVGAADETAQSAIRSVLAGFGPVSAATPAQLPRFSLVVAEGAWRLDGDAGVLYPPTDFLIALSRLEWHVIDEALARRPDLFQMHAGAVSLPSLRSGLVLAGKSGVGKSTLTLGLMLRGYAPFSDDVTMVNPDGFELQPFPRAFHVDDRTWELLRPLSGPLLRADPATPAGYFCPPQWAHRHVPIRSIVFPEYQAGRTPELMPMSRAEAVAAIVENTGTLHRSSRLALSTAAHIAEDVPCYRFRVGDLAESVAMLQRLVHS
jgi:hypothetical protein